uniref:Uncharacterized protein n=1 Tax=Opuntia streptacantha TaxID=393608 RepID=A0A7C8ZTD1_OPUST
MVGKFPTICSFSVPLRAVSMLSICSSFPCCSTLPRTTPLFFHQLRRCVIYSSFFSSLSSFYCMHPPGIPSGGSPRMLISCIVSVSLMGPLLYLSLSSAWKSGLFSIHLGATFRFHLLSVTS